jgi:hypothetical protein
MTLPKAAKMQLKPDPDHARVQLDELAGVLTPEQDAAGERLRAVAVELIRRGLEVTVTDYGEGLWELETLLPQARHLGPVVLDRDGGTGCRLTWEQGADIADETGVGKVADMAATLLRSVASSGHG